MILQPYGVRQGRSIFFFVPRVVVLVQISEMIDLAL